jgi:predicted nucleic acid-binding Zn ribbon protein
MSLPVRCAVSADHPPSPPPTEGQTGPDGARRLLARARQAKPVAVRRPRQAAAEDETWSAAGPDRRDPMPLADAVEDLVDDRAWGRTLTAAGLLPRWEEIVGGHIAAHCRPERLEAGVLTCVAESTAWATQLRLMSTLVLERIAADVGPGVVSSLRVHGPTAPDWRHGPLRVVGRGPRDTYG